MRRLHTLRLLEFTALFLVMPVLTTVLHLHRFVLPILLLTGTGCLLGLLRDPSFDRTQLGNGRSWKGEIVRILLRFALAACVMTAVVLIFEREHLLTFVKRVPLLWLLVMILYPPLSAYPQELIYRAFFFHRYQVLLPGRWALRVASAVAFGFMHIIFRNWPAVLLTIPAGYIFARTYDRTRSTVAAAFEHALYGDFLFTIGLGLHFYHGVLH